MPNDVSYYLRDRRLADVIALLQLLAFDWNGYPSEARMHRKLGRAPLSSEGWVKIAKEHPEFFRTRTKDDDPDRKERAALIIRYVIGKVEDEQGEKARPPLSPDMASNLFSIATDLYSKQVLHRDRWKPWIFGLIGTALGALATIVAAGLKAAAG